MNAEAHTCLAPAAYPMGPCLQDDDHRFPKCYLESWFSLDLGMGGEELSEKGWEEEETECDGRRGRVGGGRNLFTYRGWKIEGYRGSKMVEKGHEKIEKLIL